MCCAPSERADGRLALGVASAASLVRRREPLLDMQHWQDLLEALQRESDQVDGWGEVTIRLVYHEGLPREMEVVSRVTRDKLGKTLSPLTGNVRGLRIQPPG